MCQQPEKLAPEVIAKAMEFRKQGLGWLKAAQAAGTTKYKLLCAVFPDFRKKVRDSSEICQARREDRAPREITTRPRKSWQEKYGVTPSEFIGAYSGPAIPQRVAEDRDYRMSLAPRDLTARFFGDPLPGCSALDKKRAVFNAQ